MSYEQFKRECAVQVSANGRNPALGKITNEWITAANQARYSYHFEWLGRPIIQYPQDIVAVQELIWKVKPDLIIETGIAHGGSLIMSASMLALLDYCEALQTGAPLRPGHSSRRVLGVDIDIRAHNRLAIESHPMAPFITTIQGSAIDPKVVAQVRQVASGYQRVLVFLDSNHTHAHVLAELEAYAPLVPSGSYCVVFDTIVEDLPNEMFADRPWGRGDNPKTAVHAYLAQLAQGGARGVDGRALQFEIDRSVQDKLLITVAPDGYLRRV